MATYVLVFRGGGMPETEAEQKRVMEAWSSWFGELGDSLVDGGNPFGPSKAIGSGGAVVDGAPSKLTGYTIISAPNLEAATETAKGCPVTLGGASIDVYEVVDVMAAMGAGA